MFLDSSAGTTAVVVAVTDDVLSDASETVVEVSPTDHEADVVFVPIFCFWPWGENLSNIFSTLMFLTDNSCIFS